MTKARRFTLASVERFLLANATWLSSPANTPTLIHDEHGTVERRIGSPSAKHAVGLAESLDSGPEIGRAIRRFAATGKPNAVWLRSVETVARAWTDRLLLEDALDDAA